jgi:hypothetical protein
MLDIPVSHIPDAGQVEQILYTNVEVLVWKPPGLEVLASKIRIPHTKRNNNKSQT